MDTDTFRIPGTAMLTRIYQIPPISSAEVAAARSVENVDSLGKERLAQAGCLDREAQRVGQSI